MNSILRENYSISPFFYLFSFLLFLTQPIFAQEVLWSASGVGERPILTLLGEDGKNSSILVSSPFSNRIRSFHLGDGKQKWKNVFSERIPFAPRALSEAVVLQGDQGTVWALKIADGRSIWDAREPEPLDYPVAPIKFYDNHLFTLTRLGHLRRVNSKGKLAGRARLTNSWGRRRASTVPLRGAFKMLAYLDQGGRLTEIDPTTMRTKMFQLLGENGELQRAYGRSREILGATLDSQNSKIVSVQLPGLLEHFNLSTQESGWFKRFESSENLWSDQSELLALPSLITWKGRDAVLILTRHRMFVYQLSDGELLENFPLPSPAVAPPSYDKKRETYWILCTKHAFAINPGSNPLVSTLPFREKPFSLRVFDGRLYVGTDEGLIYAVRP